MSQQVVMIVADGGNPAGNDAMSTSGDSVNQNIPPPPLGGEDVGGSLSPQDHVLPGGSTYGNVPLLEPMPQGEAEDERSLVPFEEAARGCICFGPIDLSPTDDVQRGGLGGIAQSASRGLSTSASVAAAASVLTQTALNAAQQSAFAGQQAQHASQQSAIAGQQAQHASQQSAAAGQQAQEAYNVGASALQQTNALRDETSQMLGQVKTGLEALHDRQGAALSIAQHSDTRSSEAVRLVEELQKARLDDQKSFTDRMAQMEQALKKQMEVADNALKSINMLRQELDTSRAESRTLRQQLTESNWKLSSLSDQQTQARLAQAQSAAQAAERERTMMQQAEEIAARFNAMQQQQSPQVADRQSVVNTAPTVKFQSPQVADSKSVGASLSVAADASRPRPPPIVSAPFILQAPLGGPPSGQHSPQVADSQHPGSTGPSRRQHSPQVADSRPQPTPPREHPQVNPQMSTSGPTYPHVSAGPSRRQHSPQVADSQPSVSMGPSRVQYSPRVADTRHPGMPAGASGPQFSPPSNWQFSQPMGPMMPPAPSSLFNVSIKPREPPPFSGDKGQDVVAWLHQVDDYLEFVQPDERQAVAYIILLLHGNARIWWEAEYVARGHHRPNSVLELKLLLRTAFESPVREQRARSELLNLQQRTGENASTYMARTRALLHKVPGYDEKTALQQWLLGLKQPYRLEAAKQYPRTMAEAELLVSRLEDAMEFAKGGRDDPAKPKTTQRGQQQ